MKTRWNYWTCSKFADWLRGTAKPKAATSKEWKDWEDAAKKAHPVRFWLADDVLDFMQDTLHWVPDKIHDIMCYLRNRFVDKTHALTSKLEQGKWYDLDTRILNCLFDGLTTFVEDELARRNYQWFEQNNVKEHYPCAEAGVAHLNWEISLKYGKNDWIKKDDPLYGKPTHQAVAAKEVKALYNWWKNVRPKRVDPMDASGLSKLYDDRAKKYGEGLMGYHEYENAAERKEHAKLSKLDRKIEQKYEDEDTEMLIRLIKVRRKLWS